MFSVYISALPETLVFLLPPPPLVKWCLFPFIYLLCIQNAQYCFNDWFWALYWRKSASTDAYHSERYYGKTTEELEIEPRAKKCSDYSGSQLAVWWSLLNCLISGQVGIWGMCAQPELGAERPLFRQWRAARSATVTFATGRHELGMELFVKNIW